MLLYETEQEKKKLRHKPWITKAILISNTHKNKLYRQCVKLKTQESINKYNLYRNKLTRVKEHANRFFFSNVIQDSTNNTAKLWKTIKDVTKYRNTSNNQLNLFLIGNLITGIINLTIDTSTISNHIAILILLSYLIILFLISIFLF